MKDQGKQARASENVAGPVDFETPRPDLPVHFLNCDKPWLTVLCCMWGGYNLSMIYVHLPIR